MLMCQSWYYEYMLLVWSVPSIWCTFNTRVCVKFNLTPNNVLILVHFTCVSVPSIWCKLYTRLCVNFNFTPNSVLVLVHFVQGNLHNIWCQNYTTVCNDITHDVVSLLVHYLHYILCIFTQHFLQCIWIKWHIF